MDDILYYEYTKDIDYNNITWLCLNDHEMDKFLYTNYYNEETHRFITGDSKFSLYGLYYLTFGKLAGMQYFIGVTPNNINKLTILGALIYTDKYRMYADQRNLITYFSTIETNKYFRNKGINAKLIANSYEFIPHNQPILISGLSKDGREHDLLNKTKKIYYDLGFEYDIRSDMEGFDMASYHEELRKKRQL